MTQSLRILVIDDNSSDRALIIRELKREFSFLKVEEILDARGFQQALAAGNFDAIVTDYQLRWANGLEILQAVKARYPRCPVVMFTNTGTEEVAVQALKSGLDDYVIKHSNRYIRVPAAIRVAIERLEIQQRAALLEIRLQELLEQVNVGIFRSDPEGQLIEVNPAFLNLFGVNSIAQANDLDLLDTHECYLRLADQSPPQRQEREAQLHRSDGKPFWGLLTTTLNTVEGVTVVDGLLEDITERKQAELQLEQLNATLEQRVRERTAELRLANQDLEEFAYSISHDLRAPLRIIERFAQVLLEDIGESLEPVYLDYLQRISANARQLDTLITDLLTYCRLGQTGLSLEPVDLALTVSDALALLEPEIEAQQAQVSIEAPLPPVQANRLMLIQVLTNLFSNALKFVAPGVQPQVRVWAEPRNGQTRLWIEDQGIGILNDKQQQIFKPFQRLHGEEEYPGTGIGLAIVRKGVERMGGQVGVESQLGQGSRFWIELPTAKEVP